MPIQIRCNDQNQLFIHQVITASFDLNDWYTAVSQTCVMLNSVSHRVSVIIDISALDQLPLDLIYALNTSKVRFHSNLYAQIAIVSKSMVKPMQTLLHDTNILSGTCVVSSMEQANQKLNELRVLKVS